MSLSASASGSHQTFSDRESRELHTIMNIEFIHQVGGVFVNGMWAEVNCPCDFLFAHPACKMAQHFQLPTGELRKERFESTVGARAEGVENKPRPHLWREILLAGRRSANGLDYTTPRDISADYRGAQ